MCLVLEPLVECISDCNNFGFRKYKGPKVAAGVVRGLLKTINSKYIKFSFSRQHGKRIKIVKYKEKWILDANIKGFFDNISYEYLLKNLFLSDVSLIFVKNWLMSSIIEEQTFSHTLSVTFQKNIILPVFANFIFNGLEDLVYESLYPISRSKSRCIVIKSANISYFFYLEIVCYVNDFIVFSRNKYILNELVLLKLEKFLVQRGL